MTTGADLGGRACHFSSFISVDKHQTSVGIEKTAECGAEKVSSKN